MMWKSDCAPSVTSNIKHPKAATYTTFPRKFQLFHSGGVTMKAFN